MQQGKDIYFQGKIYQGCMPGESRYNYPSVEVAGSHTFVDGQCVDGLYELQCQHNRDTGWTGIDAYVYSKTMFLRRIIAIPVVHKDNSGAAINEGTKNYPLFKFFADTHNLVLLDSEIEEIIDRVKHEIENI